MAGSKLKQFCALLAGSLAVLSLPARLLAMDCSKTVVNRGGTQNGQVITLIGPALITDVDSGPFPIVGPVAVPAIFTAIQFTGANILPGFVVSTGFTTLDHLVNVGGWTWATYGPTPTDPIADPKVIMQPVGNNDVLVTIVPNIEDILTQPLVFSVGIGKKTLVNERPPAPSPIILAPGQLGGPMLEGDCTPPTFASPNVTFASPNVQIANPCIETHSDIVTPGDEIELLRIPTQLLLKGVPVTFLLHIPPALQGVTRSLLSFYLRARFLSAAGRAHVSMGLFADQPFLLLPPVALVSGINPPVLLVFPIGHTLPPPAYAPVQVCLDAFDPNFAPSPPTVTFVKWQESTSGVDSTYVDAGIDAVPTGQTLQTFIDVDGHPTTRLCLNAFLLEKITKPGDIMFYRACFQVTGTGGTKTFYAVVPVQDIRRGFPR